MVKHPELLIFGIDGASPAYIKQAVARGELPGFARLMKRGMFFDDCMPAFPSITPTVCYASYPQPRDATGGIIFQAFEKQDCYKK